ncbi:hypothetical protein [Roseomonas elaeocarpi]|uniref:Lipoprotein n=1 Tax=Roseomonas elaeocarpi TaxID=907779 RepID=A0ABV6JXQ0_9PROT
MTKTTTLLKPVLLLAALAACAPVAEQRSAGTEQQDARVAECRREAERVVLYRDRGQTMRVDENESRVGVSGISGFQTSNNRLGATFARDRLAAECVRDAQPPGTGLTGPNGTATSGTATVLPQASRPASASPSPSR